MRLELAAYAVEDVRFTAATRWRDGVLEIDRDELVELVRRDPLVERAELEVARPGESARIVTIQDIIEPRVKVAGKGVAYPGIVGRPVETVGSGRTNRLAGFTLMPCTPPQDVQRYGLLSSFRPGTAYGDFLDMSGPGAVSPWAATVNLCLLIEPARHLAPDPANRVIQQAMLAVQDRLAEATRGETPAEVEVFDLTPRPGLPGFVYIHSIVSPEPIYLNPDSTLSTAVYGITRLTQPWLLHPTEVLDGAACGSFFSGDFYRWFTWPLTNSIVLHMCRRHGVDFNFLGCIMVRTMWEEQRQKELMANRAALLAVTLGAAGAIVTPTLRGQRMLDTMAVVRACEATGVKVVLITEEEDDEDGAAPPLLVTAPEGVGLVSTGDGSAPGPFPPVSRVIGAGPIGKHWYGEQPPPKGRYGTSHLNDVWGFSRLACVDY
jgi:glycine/sarcosine/betaine reductase component B subunit